MRVTSSVAVSLLLMSAVIFSAGVVRAANPILPLWEFVPDGEPYVFEDPDHPGQRRVYVYGSHDTCRTEYCGRDQVVWSAPLDDLNHWRFDGVVFSSVCDRDGNPFTPGRIGDVLFAPDIVEKVGSDGKKTYYFYPHCRGRGRLGMVAKGNRPDGPFTVINWSKNDPKTTDGVLGFDPAVFIDDDGRVYGYWGFNRSYAAELDPETMCTVKPGTKVVNDMISGRKQPGEFRFFEASSIRKIRGKYIFVYSRWTADGEFGLPGKHSTLAYAYSDHPLGPYTYGGTLVDIRGREQGADGKTVCTQPTAYNTHGGLCEINGRWWVFYHRHTGLGPYARQAMVAPVTVEVDETPGGKVTISEAEYTCEGFETDGLNPFARYAAGIASHLTGGVSAQPQYPDRYPQSIAERADDPYAASDNHCQVVGIVSGAVVGYKYFNFDRFESADAAKLRLSLVPRGTDGKVEVWAKRPNAAEGGVKLGGAELTSAGVGSTRQVEVPLSGLSALKGRVAVYLTFTATRGVGEICVLEDISFVR